MSRQTLLTPISILIAALVMLVLLLAAPNGQTGVVAQGPYDSPTATPDPSDPYIPPTDETSPTATVTTTATSDPLASPTEAAPSIPTNDPLTTPTLAPTATFTPPENAPTPTGFVPDSDSGLTPQTVGLQADQVVGDLSCTPGQPIVIRGNGPPRSGFLLLFNSRIVSGGTTSGDGQYTITLTVGNEAAGRYPVAVRLRGATSDLQTFTCVVPPR